MTDPVHSEGHFEDWRCVGSLERDPKTGRLIYRRVYPLALRRFIPLPNFQLKRSLGATSFEAPKAIGKFREAAALFARTVALAQKAASHTFDKLDEPTTAYLAEAYRVERLAFDEHVRWTPEDATAFIARLSTSGHLERVADTEARTSRDMAYYQALRARADLDGIRFKRNSLQICDDIDGKHCDSYALH